ncbi:MAG: FIST N-terminal domain-containing protein [Burkholderiaceae bacterium]
MKTFLSGHAMHPDWRVALALAGAQIEAARASAADPVRPSLGWVYLTDHYAADMQAVFSALRERWPGVGWVGAVGVGVAAGGVEYTDEPALALMLGELAPERFRIFNGRRPLRDFATETALLHADPSSLDLAELVADLADRSASGSVFGGIASSRGVDTDTGSTARHIADGVWRGGISGVAFDREVALVSRVTQGCQPIGPTRQVTAADRQVVLTLDGEPALDCLLRDLALDGAPAREIALRLRNTLVGLRDVDQAADARDSERRGAFGVQTRVRHLIGIDPTRRAIAIADRVEPDMQIAFCHRHVEAARRDLVRICAEVRDEIESPSGAVTSGGEPETAVSSPIAGALYVSCAGRGGAHFGAPSAELAIVRHALGDVPLVGFFAAGEIAHRHLYGYTGVLTVFRSH